MHDDDCPFPPAECDAIRLAYAKMMLNVIDTEEEFCVILSKITALDATS